MCSCPRMLDLPGVLVLCASHSRLASPFLVHSKSNVAVSYFICPFAFLLHLTFRYSCHTTKNIQRIPIPPRSWTPAS